MNLLLRDRFNVVRRSGKHIEEHLRLSSLLDSSVSLTRSKCESQIAVQQDKGPRVGELLPRIGVIVTNLSLKC